MAVPTERSTYGGAGPWMLGVTWTQATIAVILVALRAYAARTHLGKMRWDFIFVTIGVAGGTTALSCLTVGSLHGIGMHINHLELTDLWIVLRFTWIGLMTGLVGITFAKLSIVALLLQITTPVQPRRRALLWSIAILLVVVNAIQIPVSLTQCTPMPYLWDRSVPGGSCPRQTMANNYGYFQGAVAVLVDVVLALYPVTVIWSLSLSVRTKVAFCLLMAGGLMTYYSRRLVETHDITYELYPYLMWAMIEGFFVILLGSIPPLRPLFERIFKRKKETDTEMGNCASPNTIGSWAINGGVQKLTEVSLSTGDESP
ncbi:hypothetical protein K461DRAFT_55615 [Myriangium duriaei CBS 260.36]|uniref:Rhodopsin domain-containing protein n=1 Tax=Myriangium duriaei CBS 260.36 TaxID=1168546 RepID=A0A9P4IYA4_9PEZI|nr:hypothetical protein K461DRAFT_55615 [Myriangium duriaei CBS 260.36]